MMRRIVATVTIALVAGCAGGPAAGPSGSVAPAQSDARPAVQSKIPGQYIGRATDTKFLRGKARVDLSEAGRAVGGDFNFSFHKPLRGTIALTVAKNDLAGIMTATVRSVACTFNVTATYDPQAVTLDGTYVAKSGCSGESGTFNLTEQCYYLDGARMHSRESARPDGAGLKPC
jgi:hypothetical protein